MQVDQHLLEVKFLVFPAALLDLLLTKKKWLKYLRLSEDFFFLFQNKLSSARQAFEAFFKRYPYCYGYWKKFADMERKNGNIDKAQEVCKRRLFTIVRDLREQFLLKFCGLCSVK